jgi:hypothetical protein
MFLHNIGKALMLPVNFRKPLENAAISRASPGQPPNFSRQKHRDNHQRHDPIEQRLIRLTGPGGDCPDPLQHRSDPPKPTQLPRETGSELVETGRAGSSGA